MPFGVVKLADVIASETCPPRLTGGLTPGTKLVQLSLPSQWIDETSGLTRDLNLLSSYDY